MYDTMKNNFKSLHSTLYDILKKYNLDETYILQTIKNNWDKMVNVQIYKLVKPVKLENRVLYLQTKTSYWKTEFEQIENQILESINKEIFPHKIDEIEFI